MRLTIPSLCAAALAALLAAGAWAQGADKPDAISASTMMSLPADGAVPDGPIARALQNADIPVRSLDPAQLRPNASSEARSGHSDDTVRLGICLRHPQRIQLDAVNASLDALRRALSPRRVQVVHYKPDSREAFEKDISEGRVALFLADPDLLVDIERHLSSVRAIAALWRPQARRTEESVAAAVIVPSSNTQIRSLADLRGRSVVAASEDEIAGWRAVQGEFLRLGGNPDAFVKDVRFIGQPYEGVLNWLAGGRADAAVLPACKLEELVDANYVKMSDWRVVGARSQMLLRCGYSTELYPDSILYASPSAGSTLVKFASSALMSMPPTQQGTEWTLPGSLRKTHDLLYSLRVGPYAYLREWTLSRFVSEHRNLFFALALILLGTIASQVILTVEVRRRTKALRLALEARERLEKEAQASRTHIAALERLGTVGHMSTVLAHELKQPLGAISNYSRSLVRRQARGSLTEETLRTALAEIVDQSMRASDIVEHVRGYAKQRPPQREAACLSDVLLTAVSNYRRSRRNRAEVICEVEPEAWAEIDAWEIELLVLNLIKNAGDATENVETPRVWVSLERSESDWLVTVSDNGKPISDEKLEHFFDGNVSTKPDGLGMGLSIACSIVERHGSTLEVARSSHGGLDLFFLVKAIGKPLEPGPSQA